MYQNITYIYHVHQHDITHGPVYIFLLIQPRIQNLSLDQRCHLLSQSATCFLSKLEHWNKESSHLYIYTPGLPHRGEEHGLALQEVKIKVTKLVCISRACITPLKNAFWRNISKAITALILEFVTSRNMWLYLEHCICHSVIAGLSKDVTRWLLTCFKYNLNKNSPLHWSLPFFHSTTRSIAVLPGWDTKYSSSQVTPAAF